MNSQRLSQMIALPVAAALLMMAGCQTTPSCPHCGGNHQTHYYVIPNGHGHGHIHGHAAPLPGQPHVLPDVEETAPLPGGNVIPPAPAALPPAAEPSISEPPVLPAPGDTSEAATGTRSPSITHDDTGHLTAAPRKSQTMTKSDGQSAGPAAGNGSSKNFFEQLRSGFRDMVGPAMQ